MITKVLLLSGVALSLVIPPAWAVKQPHPTRKDSRVWEVDYDPDDIIEVWGAPGSVLQVVFAPDEVITGVKEADSIHMKGGFTGNLLTWKFHGCLVPEPAIVNTSKPSTGQVRGYVFQVETRPELCATPDNQGPPSTNVALASASIGSPEPNLKYLEHPYTDLAAGGNIPFIVKIKYPSDERVKRSAAARIAGERQGKRDVEHVLEASLPDPFSPSPSHNTAYSGVGDAALKPYRCADDGYTTSCAFPQMQEIPVLTKLGNPAVLCGQDGSAEENATFSMHDGNMPPHGQQSIMSIPGTAQAWCLRSHGRLVVELWNSGWSMISHTPATGTASPLVVRKIGKAR